ncbi:glycosyltransferase family 9 protein [Aristophania vespae]|uniref:glycosyltransferase family 9 protein n=1 Tax=Aristophania vespae TaxID=2697033 RepID=UPI0023518781|nr:glycosyltransferase family 9 protein [Aristophania vespae]UMM63330.1 ADP-heptose--LPS heptosyltransferase 2 [Aristophania vespae]
MKILFIGSHRLGDAIISTALLAALLKRYPTAKFTIICSPNIEPLFEAFPNCERLIPLEKQKHNRHWLELWKQTVLHRWSMVVDLRSSLVSLGLWSQKRFIVKGGRRAGLKIVQQAQALGFSSYEYPRVWLKKERYEVARALLSQNDKWVALAPTAGTAYKIWPPENFAHIGRLFLKRGYKIIIFYGAGTEEYNRAEPLLKALPQAFDFGGGKVLSEVAAYLSYCSLFIGNDSGLMHLAASLAVPSLGLFGPSKASQYAPSGPYAMALSAPGCEGEGDMKHISVSDVIKAAESLLSQSVKINSSS